MNVHWRVGLGAATARERFLICEAEAKAARYVIDDLIERRCRASVIGFVECTDLWCSSTRVRWGRHKGYLLLELVVYVGACREKHTRRWKVASRR